MARDALDYEGLQGLRMRVPVRLDRPPLVEAIFELRFGAKEAIGDLLPGLLYDKLKHRFQRSEDLPLASVPRDFRRDKPEFRYLPHIRLTGENQSLLIGDHVLGISRTPPYEGWGTFRTSVQEVLGAIRETGLAEAVERFSFRCVNLLDSAGRPPFAMLNGELRLADQLLANRGFRLRVEIDGDHEFINVVDIAGSATASINGVSKIGLLVSIDTIHETTPDAFWPATSTHVDDAHAVLKALFFSLLAPAVVAECGPTWSAE